MGRKTGIIDFHCDVLSKMLQNPQIHFEDESSLDVTLQRLQKGPVYAQCFAVYLSEQLGRLRFDHILQSIDLFNRKVLSHPRMKFIRWREDWDTLEQTDRIGALLSLEGVEGLEGDFVYLRTCFELGVRIIGLTWNYANWAADGVLEPRKGGFTLRGKKLIQECNRLGIILDVSHLSETGFWELAELSSMTFIASHSNAKAVCSHPRNLTDDQIRSIIAIDGRIGLVFHPPFIRSGKTASIDDLLKHMDHICGLGGANQVMFGSDFDGIDQHIDQLEHPGQYENLINSLYRRYSSDDVERFMYKNASTFLKTALPSRKID